MREMTNAYKVLAEKPDRKRPFGNPRRKWVRRFNWFRVSPVAGGRSDYGTKLTGFIK
jgi:hypothetical protein